MFEWFEEILPIIPASSSADFKSLLKQAALEISPAEAKDIMRLHGLRNDLSHFTPKSWSIELAGLPRIMNVALRLIVQLMQSEQVNYHMTGNKVRRIRDNVNLVRAALRIET